MHESKDEKFCKVFDLPCKSILEMSHFLSSSHPFILLESPVHSVHLRIKISQLFLSSSLAGAALRI